MASVTWLRLKRTGSAHLTSRFRTETGTKIQTEMLYETKILTKTKIITQSGVLLRDLGRCGSMEVAGPPARCSHAGAVPAAGGSAYTITQACGGASTMSGLEGLFICFTSRRRAPRLGREVPSQVPFGLPVIQPAPCRAPRK